MRYPIVQLTPRGLCKMGSFYDPILEGEVLLVAGAIVLLTRVLLRVS